MLRNTEAETMERYEMFKRLVLKTRKNQGLFGKGLK